VIINFAARERDQHHSVAGIAGSATGR